MDNIIVSVIFSVLEDPTLYDNDFEEITFLSKVSPSTCVDIDFNIWSPSNSDVDQSEDQESYTKPKYVE